MSGENFPVYCGISLCVLDAKTDLGEDDTLTGLIERGLDRSKSEGKIVTYDHKIDEEFKQHLKLEVSLRECIKQGMKGFDVYYQPIVCAKSGRWRGLEALCRWNSPDFGPVPPLVFIHEAEQMGLIGPLGNWVLETAIGQCKYWGLDAIDGFLLEVNFSPLQMADRALADNVLQLLHQYDYPGSRLCIEITESRELNFSEHVIASIKNLLQHNIDVALDDFGTGYSSFQNLKNVLVSMLKTERQFVADIEQNDYLKNLFHTMVNLAHAASMELVAEGIETKSQLDLILETGADYIQGYYYSQPLPSSEMAKLIDKFKP